MVAQQGHLYRLSSGKNWEKNVQIITGLSKEKTKRILAKLSDLGFIDKKELNRGTLYIPKMKKYSDDYTKRVRRVFGEGSDNVHVDNTTLHNTTLHKNIKSFENIFNFWNKQKIVEHKKLTDKMKTKINSALKEYSLEDIKKSISNYSTVLSNKKYFWSYKWTLEDFLVRGLTKFLDVPLKNYETEESKKLPPLPDGWSKLKKEHNL